MTFRPEDEPTFSMRNLQDELNRVMERIWQGGASVGAMTGLLRVPLINLYEFADRYVVMAEVPGLAGDAVDVTYLDNALTLKGSFPAPFGDDAECTALKIERRAGSFNRRIELSVAIDPDGISAKCKNGLLCVEVKKAVSASPRAVKVEADSE
ncbi:MAG: Hsp20/alpha crystallin family protein [Phycisphaerae bacterium]